MKALFVGGVLDGQLQEVQDHMREIKTYSPGIEGERQTYIPKCSLHTEGLVIWSLINTSWEDTLSMLCKQYIKPNSYPVLNTNDEPIQNYTKDSKRTDTMFSWCIRNSMIVASCMSASRGLEEVQRLKICIIHLVKAYHRIQEKVLRAEMMFPTPSTVAEQLREPFGHAPSQSTPREML